MKFSDSFSLAFRTIKSNKLRTGITVTIIALGITALIGIITAIDAMNQSLRENFSTMGANSFSIHYEDQEIHLGRRQVKKTNVASLRRKMSDYGKIITYEEAKLFKERYAYPALVTLSITGPQSIVVNTPTVKTNPDIAVEGVDENYLEQSGYTLSFGRNFNRIDVQSGRNICILGNSVAQKLYGDDDVQRAVDKIIEVAGIKYRVIGVLKDKGSSAFLNADNVVLATYNNVRRVFSTEGTTFEIGIMVNDVKDLDAAISEAKGTFRPIRKVAIDEDDNFYIDKSDSIAEVFMQSLGTITTAAAFIGLITLIGAAIGLMNIMLVAVNERTREIGLIKAIGGTKKSVRTQFLFESVLISLFGAVFGIISGVLIGNLFGMFLHTSFVVPWSWVILGIAVCSIVGLFAGLYPALKAARLDPIVALRYE
ncbi:MAG TPA: ABC transporter permease [Chitinophagaceae bacterium]|nr:ABC transporter permease [Chitinophagaceae bacterium]